MVAEELLDAPKRKKNEKRKKKKSHRFGEDHRRPRNMRPDETRNQSTAWSKSFCMDSMLRFPTSLFLEISAAGVKFFFGGPRAAERVITRPRRPCSSSPRTLMVEAINLWLTGSIDFCFEKKGNKTKKRVKEEEMEKGDCVPPTGKYFFSDFVASDSRL